MKQKTPRPERGSPTEVEDLERLLSEQLNELRCIHGAVKTPRNIEDVQVIQGEELALLIQDAKRRRRCTAVTKTVVEIRKTANRLIQLGAPGIESFMCSSAETCSLNKDAP